MITKERLEELIKEGATIYNVDYKSNIVEPINLLFTTIDGNTRHIKGEEEGTIFETHEQAEWALKYHKTRTEELALPTFEEFITYNKNECVAFVGEDWEVYELSKDYDLVTEDWCIILTKGGMGEYEWQATEENYIKACDLCLKLFEREE